MDFDSCSMEATATEATICELCKLFLLPSPCSSSYGNIMDILSEEDYYYSYGDAYHDAISYPRTIAVLSCSHVYHADCLEKTTPPANVCDPKCPSCAYASPSNTPKDIKSNVRELRSLFTSFTLG